MNEFASERIVRLLSANPFFAGLAQEALERIAGICRPQHLAARTVLFLKGDPSDGLYAIRRGQIRIGSTNDLGQQMTMNFLGGGDVFGEIALLDGRTRTADAVAMECRRVTDLDQRAWIPAAQQGRRLREQAGRLRGIAGQREHGGMLPALARAEDRQAHARRLSQGTAGRW